MQQHTSTAIESLIVEEERFGTLLNWVINPNEILQESKGGYAAIVTCKARIASIPSHLDHLCIKMCRALLEGLIPLSHKTQSSDSIIKLSHALDKGRHISLCEP